LVDRKKEGAINAFSWSSGVGDKEFENVSQRPRDERGAHVENMKLIVWMRLMHSRICLATSFIRAGSRQIWRSYMQQKREGKKRASGQ
jgi:hypothetical protein